MDQKKKQFVINNLRRASYRWPPRWAAEKKSKVGRNQYLCVMCNGIFGKKDTSLDHKIPVVDPDKGFEGFDVFIDRLFCEEDNWQRLCNPCHDLKTGKENKVRKETKAKKKRPAKKIPKLK